MLDLFTIVWGQLVNFYLKVTLPSLLQKGNIPAVSENIGSYSFYTSEETRRAIRVNPLYLELEQLVPVVWNPLPQMETTRYILHQMEVSAANKNYIILVPPSTAWGNNSLQGINLLVQRKFNPIVYPMAKVYPCAFPPILDELEKRGKVSNRKLVSISMKHFASSGAVIKRKMKNAWSISCSSLTPVFIPDDDTVELFSSNFTAFSGFSQVIAYYMMTREDPLCLVGNSDVFFVAKHLNFNRMGPRNIWQRELADAGEKFFPQFEIIWQGEKGWRNKIARVMRLKDKIKEVKYGNR